MESITSTNNCVPYKCLKKFQFLLIFKQDFFRAYIVSSKNKGTHSTVCITFQNSPNPWVLRCMRLCKHGKKYSIALFIKYFSKIVRLMKGNYVYLLLDTNIEPSQAHYWEPATLIISQYKFIFTDQSAARYFFREIGQFQCTWACFGKDKTMRPHVNMSTSCRHEIVNINPCLWLQMVTEVPVGISVNSR